MHGRCRERQRRPSVLASVVAGIALRTVAVVARFKGVHDAVAANLRAAASGVAGGRERLVASFDRLDQAIAAIGRRAGWGCLARRIQAPAADAAAHTQAAAVLGAHGNAVPNVSRTQRRSNRAVRRVAPTTQAVIREQQAIRGVGDGKIGEALRRERVDVVAVAAGGTPTGDFPAVFKAAVVAVATDNLRVNAGRRRVPRLVRAEVGRVAPTLDSAAHLGGTGRKVVGGHAAVLARHYVKLALSVVGAPALYGLGVFSDHAAVIAAAADGQHRGDRRLIGPGRAAPADQLIVRGLGGACRRAAADPHTREHAAGRRFAGKRRRLAPAR